MYWIVRKIVMKHTVYFSNTYTTYMFDNTIPLRTMKALREYCISLDWI